MGILGRIRDALTGSEPEIRFHRLHVATADGDRETVTYVTGAVADGPTPVACSAPVWIPEGTMLVEAPDEARGVTVNDYTYPLYQYTTASPEAAPSAAEPVPERLTGETIPAQELGAEAVEELEELLP